MAKLDIYCFDIANLSNANKQSFNIFCCGSGDLFYESFTI